MAMTWRQAWLAAGMCSVVCAAGMARAQVADGDYAGAPAGVGQLLGRVQSACERKDYAALTSLLAAEIEYGDLDKAGLRRVRRVARETFIRESLLRTSPAAEAFVAGKPLSQRAVRSKALPDGTVLVRARAMRSADAGRAAAGGPRVPTYIDLTAVRQRRQWVLVGVDALPADVYARVVQPYRHRTGTGDSVQQRTAAYQTLWLAFETGRPIPAAAPKPSSVPAPPGGPPAMPPVPPPPGPMPPVGPTTPPDASSPPPVPSSGDGSSSAKAGTKPDSTFEGWPFQTVLLYGGAGIGGLVVLTILVDLLRRRS